MLRQRIRVTGVAHVEAVLHGLHVEAGSSTWHGTGRLLAWSELTVARSALQ
jgi:hypothetical protein